MIGDALVQVADFGDTAAETWTFKDGTYDVNIASHDGANGLKLAGTLVGSSAAELNMLDGSAKSTSSITIADADAFIIIDGSVTKQIPASDLTSYLGSSSTRVKTVQSVTASIAADALYIADGMNSTLAQNDPTILDVFVNGQLMASGSAATDGDYTVDGRATNLLKFFFGLEVDDVVHLIEHVR